MSNKVNGWLIKAVIALAAFVFGTGVAWGVMRTQVTGLDKAVNNQELRIRTVEGDLREIKTLQQGIRDDIKEIKEAVK